LGRSRIAKKTEDAAKSASVSRDERRSIRVKGKVYDDDEELTDQQF
jgi:hypothetical protein